MEFINRVKSFVQASANEPFWKFLLLTGLICAILVGLTFNAQPSEIDDNYHYMNLGRALYEGKGFVRLDTPGHPPEDIVTPGYPLILAGIMKIMGDPKPLIALKLFSTLCYLLTILISVTVFVRIMKLARWVAFLFAVFMSITHFVIEYASVVLTEAPFMLFCALTVWLILLYERDKRDFFFYLATLTTILGIYIRLPGAPLAVAVFLWLIIRKDYKKAIIFGAIVGVTIGAWVIPKILQGRFLYGGQFVVRPASHIEAARTKSYFSRYFYNMGHYIFAAFPRLLFPILLEIYSKKFVLFYSWLEVLIGLPLLALIVFGVFKGLKDKETGFPYFFFASYYFIFSFFSSVGIRYTSYTFPWFILAFISGVISFGGHFPKHKKLLRLTAILLSFILLILAIPPFLNVVSKTSFTRKIAQKGYKPPQILVSLNRHHDTPKLHRLYDACDWIRTELPEDVILMAPQLRTSYYYSERPCLSPVYWEDIMKREGINRGIELRESEIDSIWLWALDQGVSHIIADPVYGVTRFYIRPALARYQDCLRLIYQTREPITRVFEIDTTCLRNFLVHNDKAEIDRVLREIARLTEEKDKDSLSSLLSRRVASESEVIGIARFLSYYIQLNEFKDLLLLFEASQVLYPENPILWLNWGIEHNRLSLVDVSIPAFKKALEFGADSGDCYNNLGVAFTMKKDFEAADVNFRKAMLHSDTNATILKNRIANLITLKRISEADSLIEWAVRREYVPEEYKKDVEAINKTYTSWKRSVGR
jgi:tetratricopeptide (TPR) repeat protein